MYETTRSESDSVLPGITGKQYSWPSTGLKAGEFAVLIGTDGSRKFCRIRSVSNASQFEGGLGDARASIEPSTTTKMPDIQAEIGRKEGAQIMRE
jgi:hypothetical protein